MSVVDVLSKYPAQSKVLGYGTAGFRENVSLPLHSVFVKMGVLAAMRSRAMGSRSVGLMVTASHNPECDNGVKLVDADGGMMTQAWEPYATELVNTAAVADVVAALDKVATKERVPTDAASVVVVGRDTRPHSAELAECIALGAAAAGATVHDMGLVTTPQLHFVVQQANARATAFPVLSLDRATALRHYYETLGTGYLALRDSADSNVTSTSSSSGSGSGSGSGGDQCVSETDVVVIDGSNGIGAVAVAELTDVINTLRPGALRIDLRNGAYAGPVNDGCGAEHVQKGQVPPHGVSAATDLGQVLVSFDGDADRIVFHAYLPHPTDPAGAATWVLLDGDKIAALLSVLIARELKEAGLDTDFSMGVVQTAYANGASTAFLRAHAVPVVMAKTGVKYLHHKAQEFDVGVYFEANGHGTVLLSERLIARVDSAVAGGVVQGPRAALAIRRLAACTKVINQAVGDALSDMLMALATLRVLRMDLPAWRDLYTDLPSKQVKVAVSGAKKATVVCSDDETRVLAPAALQAALDGEMAKTPQGRCFVRPSGTEDCVRVYAEAATQDAADALAAAAVIAINTHLS